MTALAQPVARVPLRAGRLRLGLLHAAITLALAVAALVDVPRAVRAGPMTGLGAATVAQIAIAGLALLAAGAWPKRLLASLAPFAALLAWAGVSAWWAPPRPDGVQNALAYLLFGVLAAAAGTASARSSGRTEQIIGRGMRWVDVVGLGLVAASVALRGLPVNIDAVPWLVHPRALALLALVPLSWHLAAWYHDRAREIIPACLWVAAIFVSLSRTATATALILVAAVVLLRLFARRRLVGQGAARGAMRRAAWLGLVPLAVVAAALVVAPFRARLFARGGPGAPGRETMQISDNGRMAMWRGLVASAREAPIIGHGLGSSHLVVSQRYEWVGHPHNDYLRIWHDLGAIGLAFLVLALGGWLRALGREWRWGERHASEPAPLHLAALLTLAAVMLGMLTDNPLVYSFVMAPAGVVIGAALGVQPAADEAASFRSRRGGLSSAGWRSMWEQSSEREYSGETEGRHRKRKRRRA
ncbi:MAG: O-antigen ligase family protein [Gemmatimonadaceae bacterium]